MWNDECAGAWVMVRATDAVAGGWAEGFNCAVATLRWVWSPCILVCVGGREDPVRVCRQSIARVVCLRN